MIKRTHVSASLITAALVIGPGALAAQHSPGLHPKVAPTGIAYVSDGVGERQQQAMKDVMKDYNLRLTFAREQSGAYLAGVKVTVDHMNGANAGSQILETMSDGPMLFVKLPAGTYQVRAQLEGQVRTRSVSIDAAQGQDLVLHFPAK